MFMIKSCSGYWQFVGKERIYHSATDNKHMAIKRALHIVNLEPDLRKFMSLYIERRSTTKERWDNRKLKRILQKELDNNNIHATLSETRRKL